MSRLRISLAHARAGRDDDGMAMIAVLGVMVVLTAFLLVTLAAAIQNLTPTRADQDAKSGMAAAQAGVEEYLARLNANDSYWAQGNTDPTNPAFTAAGMSVPGTNSAAARFRYQLITSPTETSRTGKIRIRVTGISTAALTGRTVERSLTATLQPAGFLDYVYMTDIEASDPDTYASLAYATYKGYAYATNTSGTTGANSGTYRYLANATRAAGDCSRYYYDGRSSAAYTATASSPVMLYNTGTGAITTASATGGSVTAYCREIQFASGDVINGPLHSNDALKIGGSALFTRPRTESSWPYCQSNPTAECWWGGGVPKGTSNTPPGYLPKYAAPLAMPPGNESLLQHVEPRIDDPSAPAGPGCLYTGATRITFQGSTMKVYSPNTTSAAARCLDVASRGSEQVKVIPPVIYVNRSTSTSCAGVGYPVSGESTSGGFTTDYGCTKGTVMVKGNVSGQVTVAAKDDVVVVGDLTRGNQNSGSTDIIGLVGGNYVWVYHPVNSSGTNILSSADSVHNIDAAILSLRHSFIVQNYDKGSPVTTNDATRLNVTGAIAQKFRGPVGTSSGSTAASGYLKNYVYDDRLAFLQPPYFLKPASSPWIVNKVSDG